MSDIKTNVDELDVVKLAAYLADNIEGFSWPIKATKFEGGQSNPTFKLSSPSGDFVLRRQPPGKLLKSAHAVDREFRVYQALADSDVPVPRMYHLCEDREIIGSMFYVMEYCAGSIFWDAALPELASNEMRSAAYEQMGDVLAAIHSVDLDSAGLSDYGKPGNYFERQLSRWSQQYKASEIKPIPAMDQLIAWLEENLPEDDGRVSLVHGDYRLDNMMFSSAALQSGEVSILAVLDWELSTLGHPFADLAYQCMQLRMPASGGQKKPGQMSGLAGIDRTSLGIPTEKEYVARYCKRMGIDKIDHWAFYLAFSFFRLAAIAQGVAKRALDGNASSKQAGKVGAYVPLLAMGALAVIKEES
ncbi:aminoglycoside phosphotransferase [Oleiphilus sp. HI0061]|uniref:phosphotransferase family protein n=1 Tax=Oleiphilus sp. HI0061 TaxID=1822239 RepID=UPI0007CFEA18|nr:phosphotransferase family protein [Oleiphilus sp. HI0061]KZY58952.1 aminoglycoside phosphotransferase [Oleiphilus sp. HI0061]